MLKRATVCVWLVGALGLAACMGDDDVDVTTETAPGNVCENPTFACDEGYLCKDFEEDGRQASFTCQSNRTVSTDPKCYATRTPFDGEKNDLTTDDTNALLGNSLKCEYFY
ncbi:MAG: hypothetical protein ACFB00_02095 [Parvularculaceae bacterium]